MHTSDSGYSRYQSDWTGPMEMLPWFCWDGTNRDWTEPEAANFE
jgi:hypothetical protein